MPLPVRTLPVIQQWDCHGCTDCCREYVVRVTEEERQRIDEQNWDDDPELADVRPYVKDGPFWSRRYRLNQRPDGACVFLNEEGGCRIHAKFGAAAKPLACRVYPFVLVPAGDHWRVGLRYSCPSAAAGKGRELAEHLPELRDYAEGLEKQENISRDAFESSSMLKRWDGAAPPTQKGQSFNWADFSRFISALSDFIREEETPLERRLRKCLALVAICREATFLTVTGRRLDEFLEVMSAAMDEEIPRSASEVEAPGWVGRMLFRQAMAIYCRKDTGPDRGISRRGRLALMWAAYRFARGTGRVPKLHAKIPDVRFDQIEVPRGPLPASVEEVLTRYYLMKLESYQFCGSTNFKLPIWDGFVSLALTFPAICWLARALDDRPREDAFIHAMSIVDNNFGFNKLLGSRRQKYGLSLLAQRKEIDRLVAWYAR